MDIKRRCKNGFRKVLIGTKEAYKEGKEFVEAYAPKVNTRSRMIGNQIQEAFEIRPGPDAVQPDFSQPKKRFATRQVGMRKRKYIDWNNLGVDI